MNDIGTEILRQLGGMDFVFMTGARGFISKGNSLAFTIKCRKVSIVRITLTPSDYYDMEFVKIWKGKEKIVAKHNGLYSDMLAELFTEVTGLATEIPCVMPLISPKRKSYGLIG